MKLTIAGSILLVCGTAMAAGGGDASHIPTGFILKQVLHFAGFLIGLGAIVYFKVLPLFKTRKEEFTSLMQKAEKAKAEAEALKKEFSTKLQQLEGGKAETLKQAEAEAEQLKKKLIGEAEEISERLIADAKSTAQYEVEKAKLILREELLAESLGAAEKALKEKQHASALEQLDDGFVEKIQVVQ